MNRKNVFVATILFSSAFFSLFSQENIDSGNDGMKMLATRGTATYLTYTVLGYAAPLTLHFANPKSPFRDPIYVLPGSLVQPIKIGTQTALLSAIFKAKELGTIDKSLANKLIAGNMVGESLGLIGTVNGVLAFANNDKAKGFVSIFFIVAGDIISNVFNIKTLRATESGNAPMSISPIYDGEKCGIGLVANF
jgi:hypothetical protein